MESIIAFLFAALVLLVIIAICMSCSLSYISSVLYDLKRITTDILERMENKQNGRSKVY